MHSLKKRLEVEGQIHKADHILIMGHNMDLIQESFDLRVSIRDRDREKTDEQNKYKQLCTKYGIKPAKNLEELEDPKYLEENATVLRNVRNPVRGGHDDQELQRLRMQREERGRHIEELK